MKLRETEKTGNYGASCSATLTADDTVRACNKTNLMHYLSSVYSITIPLHVSGLPISHHQEVTIYLAADSQLKCTTRTIYCIYTLLHPDDGQ
jgi:hypothetical protein